MMHNYTTYKQCTKCVMDTTTQYITFDINGICNYCKEYEETEKKLFGESIEVRKKKLNEYLEKIKETGKNNPYNCIVGISGGMDSTYLAHMSLQWGLKPLFVHFDNGWNSELAVNNINNLITKLNIDLYTHVIDWEEFKDLQLAYFKASVLDIEVPTDQLIFAVLFKIAKENNIKYVLEGYNFRTEFGIPKDWSFEHKFDLTNLKNIHKQFGKLKLNKFPTFSKNDLYEYDQIYRIKSASLVNFIDFNYHEVLSMLQKEYNYIPYQYKHYESIFTRFYQGYILPKKWNIDKRLAHLSTRIRSGFITRNNVITMLKEPPYPIIEQQQDKDYLIKKWDITLQEFENIMNTKPVEHEVYGIDKDEISKQVKLKVWWHYFYLFKIAYPLGIIKRT